MASPFGWSLPPGVSYSDIDPPEGPCAVCGIEAGACICPECPTCGQQGAPECYEKHGLVRSQAQIDSLRAAEERWAADAAAEAAAFGDIPEEPEPVETDQWGRVVYYCPDCGDNPCICSDGE